MVTKRKNYICNFRAPDLEHYNVWLNFKKMVRSSGRDICYVILTFCQGWIRGINEGMAICRIATPTQIINLQQQNTFVYSVQKPRREPFEICSRKKHSSTLASLAFQAYVIEKARDLQRSFSFRDFLELGHDFFRKCILRLKNRGKILPMNPRSNPRFYILREWRSRYPTMKENNGVKPGFTRGST